MPGSIAIAAPTTAMKVIATIGSPPVSRPSAGGSSPGARGVAHEPRRREQGRVDRRAGGEDRADDRRPAADPAERGPPDRDERGLLRRDDGTRSDTSICAPIVTADVDRGDDRDREVQRARQRALGVVHVVAVVTDELEALVGEEHRRGAEEQAADPAAGERREPVRRRTARCR